MAGSQIDLVKIHILVLNAYIYTLFSIIRVIFFKKLKIFELVAGFFLIEQEYILRERSSREALKNL